MSKSDFNPDYASPPGDTLKELLDILNVSQSELSRQLGRPKKTINEIIKGKAAITPETALQLEAWFPKISARFWMVREVDYRLALARQYSTIEGDEQERQKRIDDFIKRLEQNK